MKVGDLVRVKDTQYNWLGIGVVTIFRGGHNNEYIQVYINHRKLWFRPEGLEVAI